MGLKCYGGSKKKMCPSISLVTVKKIFGTLLVDRNEIFEKAGEKKQRGDTHGMLEEIACRSMLERVFPLKFHSHSFGTQ